MVVVEVEVGSWFLVVAVGSTGSAEEDWASENVLHAAVDSSQEGEVAEGRGPVPEQAGQVGTAVDFVLALSAQLSIVVVVSTELDVVEPVGEHNSGGDYFASAAGTEDVVDSFVEVEKRRKEVVGEDPDQARGEEHRIDQVWVDPVLGQKEALDCLFGRLVWVEGEGGQGPEALK